MRSALLASLALTAALTSAFAPSIAEACGGYMPDPTPRVFALDTHNVLVEGTDRWQHRSFVMLAPTQRPDADWQQLAPGTFDPTRIASETATATPTTMTLVGPSGTSIVSSKRRAIVTKAWTGDTAFAALEVAIGNESQFQIALAGSQPDAKWLAAAQAQPTKQTIAWVKNHGLDTAYVYVANIQGTTLRVISAHQPNDIGLTSIVMRGATTLARAAGTPIGGLDLDGKRYVLFESNGLITPVAV